MKLSELRQMIREEVRNVLNEADKKVTYTAEFEFLPRGEDAVKDKAKISATADSLSASKSKVMDMAKKRFKKGYEKIGDNQ